MYQRINSQNGKQIDNRVKQEGDAQANAENKTLPSLVGNEGMNRIISPNDAGNNGETGNVPNSVVNTIINAAEDVKEKKAEPKKNLNNNKQPDPKADAPEKNKPLFYKDVENDIRNQEFEFDVDDDMAAELDPNESQEVSYSERRNDELDDDLLIRSDMMGKNGKKGDLKKAEKDLYPVKNWNFTAQKMKDVKGTNWWTKFKNKAAYIFSNVFGFLSSGFGLKQTIAAARQHVANKKKRSLEANSKIQKKKDHTAIPGWEGAKYDPNANSGEDILADFRRVPTVWSRVIGEKASEEVNKEEKPLPPTVTIYVEQPKNNSEQSMAGTEMGHTMIGIEYSRFSYFSNRYERYKLQYGFYPVMSISKSSTSTFAMMQDAIIPGQLMNDAGHSYTVSRTYPATAKQVNAILQASETYADGGYGYFARNCTTFVRDMAKLAHLPVSDKLFELEEVGFSNLANLGRIASDVVGENNLSSGMEEGMLKNSQREDQSYANYGNNRVTEEDFDTLKWSTNGGPSEKKETYIPGSVGEKLRRETTGQIGSNKYKGNIKDDFVPEQITKEINKHGTDLKTIIVNDLLSEAQRTNKKIPSELNGIINSIPNMGNTLIPFNEYHRNKKMPELGLIEYCRTKMSADISRLNTLYFQYFKGDKRLHEPVMNMISLMNTGIDLLDNDYIQAYDNRENADLGKALKEVYDNKTVKIGDTAISISPTLYEAYLQIYKTPEKAIKEYTKFQKLQKSAKEGSLSSREKKDLQKAKRMHELALDFVKAHRYMMDKENYNQQDVDYAFMELNREKQDGQNGEIVTGNLLDSSTGETYISLIFESIFRGLRNRYKTFLANPEEKKTEENTIKWLDNDLSNSILQNRDKMITFLRGLKKSVKQKENQKADEMKDKKPEKKPKEVDEGVLYDEFSYMFIAHFTRKLFDIERKDIKIESAAEADGYCQYLLHENAMSKQFQTLIKVLIKQVLLEDKTADDALVQIWNKQNSQSLPSK